MTEMSGAFNRQSFDSLMYDNFSEHRTIMNNNEAYPHHEKSRNTELSCKLWMVFCSERIQGTLRILATLVRIATELDVLMSGQQSLRKCHYDFVFLISVSYEGSASGFGRRSFKRDYQH